jgi:Putative Ig domain/Bacterial Ig-like domain (group 2)
MNGIILFLHLDKIRPWSLVLALVILFVAGGIARWDFTHYSFSISDFIKLDETGCDFTLPSISPKDSTIKLPGDKIFRGVITVIPSETSNLVAIQIPCEATTKNVTDNTNNTKTATVPNSNLKTFTDKSKLIGNIQIGDEVFIQTSGTDTATITGVSLRHNKPSGFWIPLGVMLTVALSLLIALHAFFGSNEPKLNWKNFGSGFTQLCVGKDGRLSNSQTQIAVWFFTVITSLLTILIFRITYTHFRYANGIGIPESLLVLSGLSTIVFVGARAATEAQVQSNPNSKTSLEPPKKASIYDLFTNDQGTFELADFQMIVVTVVAVLTYLLAFQAYLEVIPFKAATQLPDVTGTVLALFGLGQGAYLIRKISGAATPTDTATTKTSFISEKFLVVNEYVNLLGPTLQNAVEPLKFSISPSLPAGLTLNTASGGISGTPTTISASKNYTLTVTDKNNLSSAIILRISILDEPAITRLVLPESATIQAGETLTLSVTFEGIGNFDRTITWASSPPAVAHVINGVVTWGSSGETTITATSVKYPAISANILVTCQ